MKKQALLFALIVILAFGGSLLFGQSLAIGELGKGKKSKAHQLKKFGVKSPPAKSTYKKKPAASKKYSAKVKKKKWPSKKSKWKKSKSKANSKSKAASKSKSADEAPSCEVQNSQVAGRKLKLIRTFYFPFGASELTPAGQKTLRKWLNFLDDDGQFVITGHTDTDGSFNRNRVVSCERADGVKELMAQTIGQDRLYVQGHAYLHPAVKKPTSKDRHRNRRVEVYRVME